MHAPPGGCTPLAPPSPTPPHPTLHCAFPQVKVNLSWGPPPVGTRKPAGPWSPGGPGSSTWFLIQLLGASRGRGDAPGNQGPGRLTCAVVHARQRGSCRMGGQGQAAGATLGGQGQAVVAPCRARATGGKQKCSSGCFSPALDTCCCHLRAAPSYPRQIRFVCGISRHVDGPVARAVAARVAAASSGRWDSASAPWIVMACPQMTSTMTAAPSAAEPAQAAPPGGLSSKQQPLAQLMAELGHRFSGSIACVQVGRQRPAHRGVAPVSLPSPTPRPAFRHGSLIRMGAVGGTDAPVAGRGGRRSGSASPAIARAATRPSRAWPSSRAPACWATRRSRHSGSPGKPRWTLWQLAARARPRPACRPAPAVLAACMSGRSRAA